LGLLFLYIIIAKKSLQQKKFSFLFAITWLLILTALLCTPGTEFPRITWKNKIFLDKWIHAALFAILVIAWCWVYSFRWRENKKRIFTRISIVIFIYGIGTELVQEFFVPYRSFEIPDIIADGVGSAIGYFISAKRFIKK
jgi:VanZ family protein